MKKNLKNFLGSLSVIGLTASVTMSTIACNHDDKKTVVQQLSDAITNALNNDATVFYDKNDSSKVLDKIKLVIENTSILTKENYKLSDAKVGLKEDGKAEEFSGLLELDKKYNFKVEINHQNNEEKLKKIVEGSVTVTITKKAENTKALLDKFDISNIDNFTNLGNLLSDSIISKDVIIDRIQKGVKNQWFAFDNQNVEIITSNEELKIADDKKSGHTIKFKLLDKDSLASKEFETKFKYTIQQRSNDLSKLKQNFISKTFSLEVETDGKILLSKVKTLLDPDILTAIREFAGNNKIDAKELDIKYYKEKILATELSSQFELADDAKNLFALVASKSDSTNLVPNKDQILIIKIKKIKR